MKNGTIVLAFILAGGLFARCTNEYGPNREMAHYLDLAGQSIVNHLYGGGQKPEIQLHSSSYNHHTKSYRIQLRLQWKGPQGNGYWAEGILIVKEQSAEMEWVAETMSHSLKTFLNKMRLSKGAIGVSTVVLEAKDHAK